MSVKYTDNSQKVFREMEKRIAQALHAIGVKWLANVRPIVPVDTTRLQKSMSYTVDAANKRVIVHTDVDYAPFVELGTSKMAAQPYLKPSILEHINDYKAEVQKVLGSGWGVSVNIGGISY